MKTFLKLPQSIRNMRNTHANSADLLTSATHTRALNTPQGGRTYANHRSGRTRVDINSSFISFRIFSFGYIDCVADTWARILLFSICLKVRFGGGIGRVDWVCGGQVWSIGRHHPLQVPGYKSSGSNRGVFFPPKLIHCKIVTPDNLLWGNNFDKGCIRLQVAFQHFVYLFGIGHLAYMKLPIRDIHTLNYRVDIFTP